MPSHSPVFTDYDRLMKANLVSVFNERDADQRLAVIGDLYAPDAVLYEKDHPAAEGHSAIAEAVRRLLGSLPPHFVFTATGAALGHHGLARLHWMGGPPSGPIAVNGMDVARFRGERIHSLHVFIEPGA